MEILRIPKGRKLAKVTISSPTYTGGFVRMVMMIKSTMQSMAETGEFTSAEEAEQRGIAWAENHGADILVIEIE